MIITNPAKALWPLQLSCKNGKGRGSQRTAEKGQPLPEQAPGAAGR